MGREGARSTIGRGVGHDFQHHTTILPAIIGIDGMRARMIADLGSIQAAVTWTMDIPGWGRHAIAGYRGLVSITTIVHVASLHIFDPNTGEYVGDLDQLEAMLRDLFKRNPHYNMIVQLTRTTTG